MPDNLRSRIGEEFDYLALLSALKGYARSRDRITALLRQGAIVRVKKGIYVFGEGSRARPFSGRPSAAGRRCGSCTAWIASRRISISPCLRPTRVFPSAAMAAPWSARSNSI